MRSASEAGKANGRNVMVNADGVYGLQHIAKGHRYHEHV